MRLYDTPGYRRLRSALQLQVRRGGVVCWRCDKAISPLEPFDIGHDDVDKSIIRGAEHRRCNRATSTHAAMRRRRRTAWLW